MAAAAEYITRKQLTPGTTDWDAHVRLVDARGIQWVGWARVEKVSFTFGNTEVAKYSLTLKGQGAISQRAA